MTTPSSNSNKVTRVQLSLYAQRLKNVAGIGKGTSDPYAVVTLIASDPSDKPKILGQTEVIKNTLSLHWTTNFTLEYEFGKPTRVNIGIYDEVRKAKTNIPMGSAVFEIGAVLGARGGIKAKKLKHGGTVFCRVEKAPQVDAGTLNFSLRGYKLKNVDGVFGKSDPFFTVSRLIQAAGGPSWQPVYRSKHINNDLNPRWEPVSLSLNQLCDGDRDKPILVTVMDWEKSGRHQQMGSFETTVNGLLNANTPGASNSDVKSIDTSKAFHLKRKKQDYGMIIVSAASITGGSTTTVPSAPMASPPQQQQRTTAPHDEIPFSMALDVPPPSQQQQQQQPYTSAAAVPAAPLPTPMAPPAPVMHTSKPKFVDYISGGCELQMSVAIDFTGSNGDPRRPGTLHYIHRDGQLNDYEKALSAVGSIVAKYDSDQKFPVLGFGAKYSGRISHCFQVGRQAEVSGISGILEAYRGTFKTGLTMSGPTIFAEVINLTAAKARSAQEAARRIGQQAYSILLILTDGAVSDVNGTKQAIAAASDAPLSIVIVGIGNADFSAMQFLDDFQSQQGGGRDICQFVEFNKHASNKISLTQATLDEIPDQLVDYYHSKGIKPLPAITGSKVNVVAEEYNEEEDIDLSMEYNSEGEICLADSQAAMFDDTAYGNYGTYAGMSVMPPPPSTAPPAPYQHTAPQQPPNVYAPPPQYSSSTAPPSNPAVPSAPVVASPVFHVQVPPGVSPGMQLQVQNPATGQNMIVTIPPGVAPGGTFAVQY